MGKVAKKTITPWKYGEEKISAQFLRIASMSLTVTQHWWLQVAQEPLRIPT